MTRLGEIAYRLPDSPESGQFLRNMRRLLADVPYACGGPADSVVLTPPAPVAARPVTTFRSAEVPAPEVALDIGRVIAPRGGGPVPHRDGVELTDLIQRLAGHVRRVDHTGVNLPARSVSTQEWDALVHDVASATAMYGYPTGEQWPFVLPSTTGELATDIRDFVVGREPRFELVHDSWASHPTWQFALWTTLTRTELEKLFPAPYGIALPGLEDVFRSVYLRPVWPDLELRFDLCFAIADGPSDWETGEWLVTAGGRIR
ncbi:hypothetical protein ACIBSW_24490 [Actinoplanes sp. NPDC049668]|uniref:hypothetical protein n=1 Tax=unclassified Actinoplanes TaxID=2626549 RepID=UPI0033BD4B19